MLRVNLTGLQIQDLTSWYGPETFTKVKCPVWYVQDMQIYNLVKRNAELKNPHTDHFNMITVFKLQNHTIKVDNIMCVLHSSDIKALCEEQSQI